MQQSSWKLLILDIRGGLGYFSTISMLHFLDIEEKIKNDKKQKEKRKKDLTLITLNLFHVNFGVL